MSDNGQRLVFDIYTKKFVSHDRSGEWMKIYLNVTGGQNYDYVLNNTPMGQGNTTVAKLSDGFKATDIASARYAVCDDHVRITVNKSDVGLDKNYKIWFKVADSTEKIKDFEDFYSLGDVAPLGRLNYVYKVK